MNGQLAINYRGRGRTVHPLTLSHADEIADSWRAEKWTIYTGCSGFAVTSGNGKVTRGFFNP